MFILYSVPYQKTRCDRRSTWQPARQTSVITPLHDLFALRGSTSTSPRYSVTLTGCCIRVPELIEFKLSVLVFRCLHGTAPPYLASELRRVADVDTRKRLRSSSTSALVTPSLCRTTIGDRAFFVAAPRVWNTLPSSVTASETLGTFKRSLKTHLFATSFP